MSSDCDKLIQFDTISISSNFVNQHSVLQLVNQENYSTMKEKLSALMPGYFDGDYSDFSQKRESFPRWARTPRPESIYPRSDRSKRDARQNRRRRP